MLGEVRRYLQNILMITFLFISLSWSQPKPGDVFREYRREGITYSSYTTGFSTTRYNWTFAENVDTTNAIRAEIEILKLNHAKVKNLQISFNGKPYITFDNSPAQISQPFTVPECWYTIKSVPLGNLQQGKNKFQIKADTLTFIPNELTNPSDTVLSWMAYMPVLVLRIYYDPLKKSHPTGSVTSPAVNAKIGTDVTLSAIGTSSKAPIKRVDFIGYYTDVSYRNDKKVLGWHYTYDTLNLTNTLGFDTAAPYQTTWKTHWVPDQPQPLKIAALISDTSNLIYMTPSVDNLTLDRQGWSVELCEPENVPDRWSVNFGEHSCRYSIKGAISTVKDARLSLYTFSSLNFRSLKMNGVPFDPPVVFDNGWGHEYKHVMISPVSSLKSGQNQLSNVHYAHQGLGLIMWPGPYLLIRYGNAPETPVKEIPSPVVSSAARILPLGNSITAGSKDSLTYRYYLYNMLKSKNYSFDLVGSREDKAGLSTLVWDRDHSGYSGFEVDWLKLLVPDILKKTKPDIVLAHLGTNDMIKEIGPIEEKANRTIEEIRSILTLIHTDNPSAIVLLAKPVQSRDTAAYKGFKLLGEKVSSLAFQSPTHPYGSIILVDQWSAVDSSLLKDNWHPGALGCQYMAQRWFETLDPIVRSFSRPGLLARNSRVEKSSVDFILSRKNQLLINNGGDGKVTIYNILGKKILQVTLNKNIKNQEVRLSKFTAGTYFVKYERPGGNSVFRFSMP